MVQLLVDLQIFLDLVPQEILVTAPKIARGNEGTLLISVSLYL